MKEVSGKVAFVTGGGSGIGLGMAKVFTAAGIGRGHEAPRWRVVGGHGPGK